MDGQALGLLPGGKWFDVSRTAALEICSSSSVNSRLDGGAMLDLYLFFLGPALRDAIPRDGPELLNRVNVSTPGRPPALRLCARAK